ncbi:P-loop containing nucleoside triphosphate hydrolase protein [Mycena olivaceomarginata]|nr:P-loop containing nucleoside triphosphate hydrolase protein [Mycena olivaceomarginata]
MSSPTRNVLGRLPIVPNGTLHRVPATPRKRKTPVPDRLLGRLGLGFDLDDWQAELIRRLRQGYDSIMVAGTGYGKSVIFEGLAACNKAKIVIIICPLKALERDQVCQPPMSPTIIFNMVCRSMKQKKKGLIAKMVNEDTVCPELWANLRQGRANLYYVSPEMALSSSFIHLWQDRSFRNRVQALVIDEAHCIVEWGDNFRKEYSGLAKLRDYIGQDTPILAATATCDTETFKVIWKSLKFGCRPFWGLDVGTDRQNLVYMTRVVKNPANPILDIINIFPAHMDKDTPADVLAKCLFYFDTIEACGTAVETLRKCLPAHLRPLVQTFKSTLSEVAKAQLWDRFNKGEIRILCATDAAGMGCNVADVMYTILCSLTDSLSVLAQRWGRTARNRSIFGTCILLVPQWAFRPEPADDSGTSGPQKKKETKADTDRRKKLDKAMEGFVNAVTDLNTYNSLNQEAHQPVESGWRSQAAQRELSWTPLYTRHPLTISTLGPARCTAQGLCLGLPFPHPILLSQSPPTNRLCLASRLHHVSSVSNSCGIPPFMYKVPVPQEQRDDLVAALDTWRTTRQAQRAGGRSLLSKRVLLSDAQIHKLADHGTDFLREATITPDLICKLVPWDLASQDDLKAVALIIKDWRFDAQRAIGLTPRGGHRAKQQNTMPTPPACYGRCTTGQRTGHYPAFLLSRSLLRDVGICAPTNDGYTLEFRSTYSAVTASCLASNTIVRLRPTESDSAFTL